MDPLPATCATQFSVLGNPSPPSAISIVREGEGISLWALGVLVTIKALGNETGGSYSLFEDVVPPGVGPPSHVHTREDETWYMLEGELEWKVGDQEFNATRGSFIHLPRLVPHAFANRSGQTARMVLTYAPAGFERWFLDIGKPISSSSVDPLPPPVTQDDIAHAVNMAKEYGLIFVGSHDHHASQ